MSLPASEIAAGTQWKKGAELGVDLALNTRWLLVKCYDFEQVPGANF